MSGSVVKWSRLENFVTQQILNKTRNTYGTLVYFPWACLLSLKRILKRRDINILTSFSYIINVNADFWYPTFKHIIFIGPPGSKEMFSKCWWTTKTHLLVIQPFGHNGRTSFSKNTWSKKHNFTDNTVHSSHTPLVTMSSWPTPPDVYSKIKA